jgi:hypothetical protein
MFAFAAERYRPEDMVVQAQKMAHDRASIDVFSTGWIGAWRVTRSLDSG